MRTKTGVLGIKKLVYMLPTMVTSCLKYTHENGCPWDEYTCTAAADYGHLECLQYAHDNGCAGSAKYAHLLPRAQTHEPLVRHLIFCLTTGTSRQWYRYHTYLVFCIFVF